MIEDLALRWVTTILFALAAVECLLAVSVARGRPTPTVGHLLHLVMAVAMGVMAWPRGAELPTIPPMVFFGCAAVWFAVIAVTRSRGPAGRAANAYHTVMMLAMAWMYAVMNGNVLPGQSAGHAEIHHHGHHMPGPVTVADIDHPPWITAVNWVLTIGFAAAAVFWMYRYFVGRQVKADALTREHFGVLCQAMMAAGMAIMFGVML